MRWLVDAAQPVAGGVGLQAVAHVRSRLPLRQFSVEICQQCAYRVGVGAIADEAAARLASNQTRRSQPLQMEGQRSAGKRQDSAISPRMRLSGPAWTKWRNTDSRVDWLKAASAAVACLSSIDLHFQNV